MKEKVIDIPCFVDEKFLKKCQGRSLRYLESVTIGSDYSNFYNTEDYRSGCIQLLAPFPINDRKYLKNQLKHEIGSAACYGYMKAIKALVPLVDDLKTLKTNYCLHNNACQWLTIELGDLKYFFSRC